MLNIEQLEVPSSSAGHRQVKFRGAGSAPSPILDWIKQTTPKYKKCDKNEVSFWQNVIINNMLFNKLQCWEALVAILEALVAIGHPTVILRMSKSFGQNQKGVFKCVIFEEEVSNLCGFFLQK